MDKKTILFPGSFFNVTLTRRDKFGNTNTEYLPEISFSAVEFEKEVLKQMLKEIMDESFNDKFKELIK